ncbi:MAG: hypothetical protein K2O29_01030, partial [Ruminococcus sp.]|nr:hypothetical protein [Ruminococcus sp.]
MKKILFAVIALCLTVGCSKEVQSLPTNVIVSETKTTESTKTSVTEKESTTKENITTTESVLKDSVEPPDNLILNTRENIEVYEKITVADFVTDTNVEITNGDEFIDTNEIGEFEVYINC